jgi:membrane fusion protein (multidrug efflux system)
MFGDEVVIHAGLVAGEQVAASGSFKLRESALVAIAGAQTPQSEQRQTVSQH